MLFLYLYTSYSYHDSLQPLLNYMLYLVLLFQKRVQLLQLIHFYVGFKNLKMCYLLQDQFYFNKTIIVGQMYTDHHLIIVIHIDGNYVVLDDVQL
jgi:hypothetical protein